MREIDENVIKNNEFIIIKMTFENLDDKEYSIKNVIIAKLHVIDDFNIDFFNREQRFNFERYDCRFKSAQTNHK